MCISGGSGDDFSGIRGAILGGSKLPSANYRSRSMEGEGASGNSPSAGLSTVFWWCFADKDAEKHVFFVQRFRNILKGSALPADPPKAKK